MIALFLSLATAFTVFATETTQIEYITVKVTAAEAMAKIDPNHKDFDKIAASMAACEAALGGEVRYMYDIYEHGPIVKLPDACDDNEHWLTIGRAIESARIEKLIASLTPTKSALSWKTLNDMWMSVDLDDSLSSDIGVRAPVRYSQTPSPEYVLKTSDYEDIGRVVSVGDQAINDFFASVMMPVNTAQTQAFRDYLESHKDSISMVVYMYAAEGDAGFFRELLVVIDENNQSMLFYLGYSE